MDFQCNGTKWTIKVVDEATMNNEQKNDCTLGLTFYKKHEIWLLNSNTSIIRTLKHELAHVWLWEYGHNQEEKAFNNEDVCEIIACSNDFINEVVNKYLGIEPLYLCDTEKNTECGKKSCYINNGVCSHTTNVEYARKKNASIKQNKVGGVNGE